MIPMIDDFAQIVGVDVKNCPWIDGDTDECAKEIGKAITLVDFYRFERGEGLQKREDNFAEEIAQMVK